MNTYNGLYSLYFDKAHVAAASLPPENLKILIPGISVAAVCLYEYPVGFLCWKGNPKNILTFRDLTRADVILANREKGSTRRIYLDGELKKQEFLLQIFPVIEKNWSPTFPLPLP